MRPVRDPETMRIRHGTIAPAEFKPAWWLPGPHLQTIWPAFLRTKRSVSLTRERLELPDGDFIDIDWIGDAGPIVVILHGLQGSSRSPHVRGLLGALAHRGWRGAVMHFRGCGGEPNRLPRTYHSGETGDVGYFLRRLREREPSTPVAAVGFSLGGNVLLKWLAERGVGAELATAVAVSVPFLLAGASGRLDRGISRMYRRHFIVDLHRSITEKFRGRPGPLDLDVVRHTRTFRRFDDRITAPLHGFRDAAHYYREASCRQYLRGVARPTLILHALDDPFMTRDVIPRRDELSPSIRLELSASGGHVGFVKGGTPWTARYWLEERIPRFLAEQPGFDRGKNARANIPASFSRRSGDSFG
ncbi:MAG: hydrolase [Thiotrichales bacterium]|nr:hydrolase [Thiotrichales bacterium]MCY4285761.1 hydrolase [Thiotrichales bacterium]MCY4349326.1 hydrolase [Thiotrichales bacterium]